MDRSINAGITGAILAIVITVIAPGLDWFPSFLASIIVIYIFNLRASKDGLVSAFMTYIFTNGVLGTIVLASLYVANEPYTFSVDPYSTLSPIISAITALIAGYLGTWLVQKTRPPTAETAPPLPPPLPPV